MQLKELWKKSIRRGDDVVDCMIEFVREYEELKDFFDSKEEENIAFEMDRYVIEDLEEEKQNLTKENMSLREANNDLRGKIFSLERELRLLKSTYKFVPLISDEDLEEDIPF